MLSLTHNAHHLKKPLAILACSVLLLALLTPNAHAKTGFDQTPTFIGDCESDWGPDVYCGIALAIQDLVLGIVYIFGQLFSWLLSTFAHGVVWMISEVGIDIITHPAVSTGVKVTLGLSNWIFIIAIIVIAFATILRWHEYEARKMLPKLILAAILVNFSLLFAGLMLDAANVFTIFFINDEVYRNAGNSKGTTADAIGNAFEPQRFNVPDYYGDIVTETYTKTVKRKDGSTTTIAATRTKPGDPDKEVKVGDVWAQFFGILPKAIFAVIATFIGMITLVAILVMALVRNIWVVFLLIVMPLIWALWVLPKFGNYWQKWWEKFLNWGVIYLPTLSFFLYLAVKTAGTVDTTFNQMSINAENAGFLGVEAPTAAGAMSVGQAFILLLIVVGLMIAGLKIAQNMGATGAGLGFNLATKGGAMLAKKAGKLAGAGLLAGGFAAVSGGLALTGAAAGTGLGIFKGIKKFRKSKPTKEEEATVDYLERMGMDKEATEEKEKLKKKYGAGTLKGRIWDSVKAGAGAVGMGAFPALWAYKKARDGNAYGYATERLGRGAAALSFLPGMSAVAQFLGKTSAAQRVGVENAKKEYEGMDAGQRKSMYLAAALKSGAHQAAALAVANENHELDAIDDALLKKFANAAADFNPGTKRDKIELLKAAAAHNPAHAPDITGESPTEAAQRAKTGDVEKWDEKVYLEFRNRLSDAQRKAFMAVSAKNFNTELSALTGELRGAGVLSPKLASVADELRAVAGAIKGEKEKRSPDMGMLDSLFKKQTGLMRQLKVAMDDIKTDGLSPELQDSIKAVENMRRIVGGRGEKDEHPARGYEDFTVRSMLGKVLKSAVGSPGGFKLNGGTKPASSGGGAHHP